MQFLEDLLRLAEYQEFTKYIAQVGIRLFFSVVI